MQPGFDTPDFLKQDMLHGKLEESMMLHSSIPIPNEKRENIRSYGSCTQENKPSSSYDNLIWKESSGLKFENLGRESCGLISPKDFVKCEEKNSASFCPSSWISASSSNSKRKYEQSENFYQDFGTQDSFDKCEYQNDMTLLRPIPRTFNFS